MHMKILVIVLLLSSCFEDREPRDFLDAQNTADITELPPPPLNSAETTACYDLIDWLSNKYGQCKTPQHQTKLKQELLEVWDCKNIVVIRNIDILYHDCRNGLLLLACQSYLGGVTPEGCWSQLVFKEKSNE